MVAAPDELVDFNRTEIENYFDSNYWKFFFIIITLPPKFVIFNSVCSLYKAQILWHTRKNPDFKTVNYQTLCFESHDSIFRLKQIVELPHMQ